MAILDLEIAVIGETMGWACGFSTCLPQRIALCSVQQRPKVVVSGAKPTAFPGTHVNSPLSLSNEERPLSNLKTTDRFPSDLGEYTYIFLR